MDLTLLKIIQPFIIFFICAISSAFLIILLPTLIGKKMVPTYTVSRSNKISMPKESLYNMLINYKDYYKWKPRLKKVEQYNNNEGNIVWIECYKFSSIKNTFTETKKIENSLLIYSTTNKEYAAVYSFEINEEDEKTSTLSIKETIYLMAPYLRFFYSFLFYKKRFINKIFRLIKKSSSKMR